ncbi:MAG: archease [Dehalococcoidia bacterium]
MLIVMGMRYEVIDHTADIGIVAYGSNLNALFSNAAAGMLSLMVKTDTLRHDVTKTISLEAGDSETLLVEWLNELLYIIYTEKLVLCRFDILIDKGQLMSRCAGQRLEMKSRRFIREIKAATYHNLEIVAKDGEYSARIIFDI